MRPAGVAHVAICVRDLDQARRFYVEGLGLTEVQRPDFGVPGAWLQAGAEQVHLMVAEEPPPGRQHFALTVDDLEAAVADLEAAGIPAQRSPALPGAGRQAFVTDPSGNLVELNQPDELGQA